MSAVSALPPPAGGVRNTTHTRWVKEEDHPKNVRLVVVTTYLLMEVFDDLIQFDYLLYF